MRNEFLHKRVIEQGGAPMQVVLRTIHSSGTFKSYSYRDPRFIETIEDFKVQLVGQR